MARFPQEVPSHRADSPHIPENDSPMPGRQGYNKLLERQIRKYLGGREQVPEAWQPFLEAISRSYGHFEQDRDLIERSMDNSSQELNVANERLREQAAILQRQNQILEDYAYIIAHDLKEPLRSIASFVNLIERRSKDRLDADTQEYMAFVTNSTRRMSLLLDDLLIFATIESRYQALGQRCEPTAMLNELARHYAKDLQGQAITYQMPALPAVLADPEGLKHIFEELIVNAIKFKRPDMPLQVRIGLHKEGHLARISVQDNGQGIPADFAKQAFAPFKRFDRNVWDNDTGIGLAVCKKIAQHMGGDISIGSGCEAACQAHCPGACVKVILPLAP